ncbi:CRISPR-associated endonuclease Cas1 [Candidatus Nomurabacteria bacterium]|nr:CRISPR-associated endonuclease Cas1 [Candidatus Nomurabacteria bacterium]
MSVTAHNHRSGRIIRQQVSYANSLTALKSARELITTKITNSQRLIGAYLSSRQKAGHNQVEILTSTTNRLANLVARCAVADDRSTIFQLEAQAARFYWRAFGLISHQKLDWKRVHPHATDPLNVLLNFRKILALLNSRYQTYFWYKGRCEKLENIIKFEAIKLRQAILKNEIWKPYLHQWDHHHPCH